MRHLKSGAEIEAVAASQCKTNLPPVNIINTCVSTCLYQIVLCKLCHFLYYVCRSSGRSKAYPYTGKKGSYTRVSNPLNVCMIQASSMN